MSSRLAARRCVPCAAGTPPLAGAALEALRAELEDLRGDWKVVDGHHLEGVYRFDDFRQALDFTGRVGELAEEQDHHPDIHLAWGRVGIRIWTHVIDGLTESDFVFAARADELAGR